MLTLCRCITKSHYYTLNTTQVYTVYPYVKLMHVHVHSVFYHYYDTGESETELKKSLPWRAAAQFLRPSYQRHVQTLLFLDYQDYIMYIMYMYIVIRGVGRMEIPAIKSILTLNLFGHNWIPVY